MSIKNMSLNEFCESIKKGLEVILGNEVTVTVNRVAKNNGVVLNSVIIVRKSRNISPNIYLDEYYKEFGQGKALKDILQEITEVYEGSLMKKNLDMDFFTNYEKLKEKVAYRIIGVEKNQEILKEIPYVEFLNMAIVFYCYVPDEELSRATILIYNNHLEMWGITREMLYEDAKRNTKRLLPPKLLSLERMMEAIFAEDLKNEFETDGREHNEYMPDEEWFDNAAKQMLSSVTEQKEYGGMFVLGNENKLFGAAVILYEGILKAFADRLEADIFILPSSIHEVILIPDDGEQKAYDLWKMVCDINATQVDPEEVLTDSVYYFTRNNNKINKLF